MEQRGKKGIVDIKMPSELLATQVRIPPQGGQLLLRERLAEELEREIARRKLILVAAPAGYGKTTLLSQWARTSRFPVAWLSLTEAENDPERFFRGFYQAWEHARPGVRITPVGVLLEGQFPGVQPVVAAIINASIDQPQPIVFVLDDYHRIVETTVHQALAGLLDHLPGTVHIVLSTRADPPLPVARYRARAELLELQAAELQFKPEETAAFLNQVMDLQLAPGTIEKLQNQLEGWPAGLRLAGLSLRHPAPAPTEPLISGAHRFVADYLSQDVLGRLPDQLRRFLLQTSILDRLSAPLCEAVTGESGGQAHLETLERQNLFLFALDDSRQWYRYHPIFADFLRAELERRAPGQAPELHRRAAGWFLEHDLPEPAFAQALAAGDLKLMGGVFDRYANAKLQGGEFSSLKRWLDALPEEWFTAYPAFGLARAGYQVYTGSLEACLRTIDEVENRLARLQRADAHRQLARVKAVRCYLACMGNDLAQAEAYADQALEALPEDDLGFRPGIYAALGDTYRQNGLWEQARQSYLRALDFAAAPALRVITAHIYGALADLNLRQGRLHAAARYWQKALASAQERENWGRVPLPVKGWIYIRMGELLYEWDERQQAADHLGRGLERAEMGGDVRAQIAGAVLDVRLRLAAGEVEKAAETLEHARRLVEQAPFPVWAARFERCQVELWLVEGRTRAARGWAEAMLAGSDLQARQESEVASLAVARALVAAGGRPASERAVALLDVTLQSAGGGGWAAAAIEALALQGLAKQQLGDGPGALTALEQALRLAEPEGFRRLFVDLGLPMGRLLQEARSRGVMPGYVNQLLAGFDTRFADRGPAALPEPLTQREQEILALVAAGLTNREIAEQCVISPETVKKHVSSLVGKLGAGNRTEAAARARALGLLDQSR